jgi:hypothetical protein
MTKFLLEKKKKIIPPGKKSKIRERHPMIICKADSHTGGVVTH